MTWGEVSPWGWWIGPLSSAGALSLRASQTMLTTVRSGQPRTVLVDGRAGIGKTALVEEFLAAEDDIQILRASGERWEALVSYGVVEQLLRGAGVSSTRLLASRDRALPPEEPVSVGTYILEVLGDLEQKNPVVVLVEDVHWTDTDSLRALLFALRRLVSERVLTVLTIRDDERQRLPDGLQRLAGGASGLTLHLPALTASEILNMGKALGVPDFSARAASRLKAHTQGNPLFVRALLTEMPADRWRTWEPMLPAPRAFAMQVERRLEACAPATRRLVEAASALGANVPVSVVAALAGVEDPLEALDESSTADLLRVRDDPGIRDVVFPHPLVQAAVYEHLSPSRRVRLHLAAADLVNDEGARLRHRVAAADPPDEPLAEELAAFARRQSAAGVWAGAASAFIEASRMSPSGTSASSDCTWRFDAMIGSGDLVQAGVFAGEIADFAPGPHRDVSLGYLSIMRGRPDRGRDAVAQRVGRL